MSHRQRKTRRRKHQGAGSKVLLGLGVVATVCIIGILSAAGYVLAIAASAPDLEELKPDDKGELSVVYAADGSKLGFIQSDILRRVVRWKDMPVHLRRATVAIEDERFYKHEGVDLNAIVRAGIKNLESGDTVQGGSTITQQLVRALYIKDPKRNFARKIREAKLASELEEDHSKTWILHNYLNSVPYGTVQGRTAIGVEAAAVTYFDKHAKDLKLRESALLAGLPQAPSQYNPFRNPTAAIERRNAVLRQMLENGYITQAEYQKAAKRGLGLRRGFRYVHRREPYFFDYVQDKLIERYSTGVARRGGLRIHTTINPKMQDLARDAINAYWGDPAGPSSAIVAIDPNDGKIRAMASSGTYGERRFNLAAQGHRQPGSAFKTMVLTAAVLKGVDPDSTSYTSKPVALDVGEGAPPWEVKTFGDSYIGTVSLTRATLSSDNTVYAQLILDVGPEAVCKTARLLGITTKLDCYPAEGLGGLTRGVTTLEMASAYATLASGGVRRRPTGIERVVFPDGTRDNWAKSEGKRVMTDGQAYEVTQILEANMQSGTGTSAYYGCPAAGKTGTTDEAADAWFVGYTPKLSTAVWVGYPDSRIAMPGAQGGTYAAPVWHAFMQPASDGNCDDFPLPQEPFQATPFYGDYSSAGSAGSTSTYDYSQSYSEPYSEPTYDPDYYEAPPQEAPAPAVPEVEPQEETLAPPVEGQGGGARRRRGARRRLTGTALAERRLIEAIQAAIADRSGRFVRWWGDDAAVVRARPLAVISIDTVVDGVHFSPATHTPGGRGLEGTCHRAVRPCGDGRRGGRGLRVARAAGELRRRARAGGRDGAAGGAPRRDDRRRRRGERPRADGDGRRDRLGRARGGAGGQGRGTARRHRRRDGRAGRLRSRQAAGGARRARAGRAGAAPPAPGAAPGPGQGAGAGRRERDDRPERWTCDRRRPRGGAKRGPAQDRACPGPLRRGCQPGGGGIGRRRLRAALHDRARSARGGRGGRAGQLARRRRRRAGPRPRRRRRAARRGAARL